MTVQQQIEYAATNQVPCCFWVSGSTTCLIQTCGCATWCGLRLASSARSPPLNPGAVRRRLCSSQRTSRRAASRRSSGSGPWQVTTVAQPCLPMSGTATARCVPRWPLCQRGLRPHISTGVCHGRPTPSYEDARCSACLSAEAAKLAVTQSPSAAPSICRDRRPVLQCRAAVHVRQHDSPAGGAVLYGAAGRLPPAWQPGASAWTRFKNELLAPVDMGCAGGLRTALFVNCP